MLVDVIYVLSTLLVPELLTPASVKQLIEKRNAIFSKAVNEYETYRFFHLMGTVMRLLG